MAAVYIGYYDGPLRFVDGECSGIETFSLSELEQTLKKNPDLFAPDVRFMVEKYKEYLKPI